jgi:hypothetical protein
MRPLINSIVLIIGRKCLSHHQIIKAKFPEAIF